MSPDYAKDELRKLCALMGWSRQVNKETASYVLDRIAHFDRYEFDLAMVEMEEEDRFRFKVLRGILSKYQAQRIEKEQFEARVREERELRELMKDGEGLECPDDYECGDCSRIDTCRLIHRAGLKACIKIAVDGDVRGVERELAAKFKGSIWAKKGEMDIRDYLLMRDS
jgi:molybdenum cofactor biosynthesis enzyme MoaA